MATAAPIEIFRAGRHTAVDGSVHDYSVADLQAAVDAYDYAAEPAPLVVGHPKLDAPAYGWAEKLVLDGDKIVAHPANVEAAFAEQVNDGRYKRVSASWYPKDHPQNPKPGSLYLKHIGFLGAAAPAIRGLKPVHFSEAQDAAAITFDSEMESIVADRTQEFAERDSALTAREEALAAKENALGQRETSLNERDQALVDAGKAALHSGHVAFAEAQVAEGKLAPAGSALVVGILDTLASAETISFGEADGEMKPADAFRKLFETAAPIVSFAEHSAADHAKEGGEAPTEVAAKATEFMESEKSAGRTITHAAAVRHVLKQGA